MEIVELPAMTVVGLPIHADESTLEDELEAAWTSLHERSGEIERRTDDRFVDVFRGRSGDLRIRVVGAAVEEADEVPAGMTRLEVVPARYIHHRHTGSEDEIDDAFDEIRAWADGGGVDLTDFMLAVGPPPEDDEGVHDLYVRVAGSETR